ncbi:MAG: iron dicitrate transport regulator FecR [SAR324 cluster bacterium]|nr:iron dicitrate transport regulator FecR [SAR324 cluster bacterium]
MKMILAKNIFQSLLIQFMGVFFLQTAAIGAQNSLELHSGTVKIIRSGKSQILQKAGETYTLLENDRLQTGGNTQVTLYLKDGDNTVKLFSHSFFKLDDLSEEENSVALLTGKGNFSVKVLAEPSGRAEEVSENTEKKKVPENKLQAKLGGNLKGSLAKLVKTKLRRKKERFKVRTVSALVGVRGTEFVIGTGVDSGTNVTNVAVLPEFGNSEVDLESNEVPGHKVPLGVNQVSQLREGRGWTNPVFKTPAEMIKFANADGTEIFQEVEFGPSESVAAIKERLKRGDETQEFEEEADAEGELLERLERLEELESIIEEWLNEIDASKSKLLILSMTITNR